MAQNAPPIAHPNSNLAIISLITGILGLTILPLLGSVVAVVTGQMAKREIRDSGGTLGGDGIASAGLILGWIGVGLSVLGLCLACMGILLMALGIFAAWGTSQSAMPFLWVWL
jgi:hypothetical protein